MAEFTNEMVEVTEAEVVEDVTTNESTAIVPAADEYVPEAEPEKKHSKAVAIGIGAGALALGVAAVKWGPQIMATVKAKHESHKQAKQAVKDLAKAQEIYNNLNSVDDETLKKYYNERFSTPAPEPATTNDKPKEDNKKEPENNTENAAQTAQKQATTQPEQTPPDNTTQAQPNNKANNRKK